MRDSQTEKENEKPFVSRKTNTVEKGRVRKREREREKGKSYLNNVEMKEPLTERLLFK